MREILFRAQRVDNGKWIYGDLIQFNTSTVISGIGKCDETSAVIPKTIGQFTGITDKNGTKIFEGDVIEVDGYGMVVEYSVDDINRTYGQGYFGEDIHCGFLISGYYGDLKNKLVVSNIYDRPELLTL